ncbi:MAG: PPC domain-containing protein [Planctomycetia bacterium]|nr:PPC domain-containing protein [Planctomycetia bacterium]
MLKRELEAKPTASLPSQGHQSGLRLTQLLVAFLLPASAARAEPPAAMYVFPPGGQVGQAIPINVGGVYLHGEAPFRLYGSGVSASDRVKQTTTKWFEGPIIPQPASQRAEDYPKDHRGEIRIDESAEPGVRWCRVWTSQGVSPALPFVVGRLPEVVEDEIDGEPIPISVTAPVTINGRIFPREDVDFWEFHAEKGQTISCEVLAVRLGSPLDARLEVLDTDGLKIAENSDYFAADPFVRFTAESTGKYQVRIYDSTFEGLQHFVYRLTVTAGPFVDAYYPLGGQRGSNVTLHCPGSGLPDDRLQVTLPTSGAGLADCRVCPNEVPANLSLVLEVDDLPEFLEQEPNDNPEKTTPQAVPAVFNGRIDRPGDADHWAFQAAKGETWTFDVRAARLGSPLDSVLVLLDSTAKELARSDDIAAGNTDSFLEWSAPADGVYFARVQERFASRGGPRSAYRLRVVKKTAVEDFELLAAADSVTVPREGEAKFTINVVAPGGAPRPTDLKIEGLPPGVIAQPLKIPAGTASLSVTLKADKSARIGACELKITGTAEIGADTTKIERRVVFRKGRGLPDLETVMLAVALPAPFKFHSTYVSSYGAQGTTYRRHYVIDRNSFTGPLTISLADKQARHLQGVTGPTITVPSGADEFWYPVQLPPWLEVGRTSRTTLMALGEITDADGTKHVASFSSQQQNEQIVIQADPAPLSIKTVGSLTADPARPVTIRVRVFRARSVPYPVTLELLLPDHVKGVESEKVTVPPDQGEGPLTIRFAPGCGPFNLPIKVWATAKNGDDLFQAEAKIEVVPVEAKQPAR